MKNLHKFLRIFILSIFFLVLILNIRNGTPTQLTFNLDLDNPIFRYYENSFNDSSTHAIFNSSQNITYYINIPKNSTILYSNMTLTGKISPSQTYTSGITSYSVAVGNVTDKSQIIVGQLNSVILLNSSLQNIWSFTTSGQTHRVAIGDVTSNSGKEVAVSCSDTPYVYLLNSTGKEIWSYNNRGEAKSVAIGDITSDLGEEGVVGAGN